MKRDVKWRVSTVLPNKTCEGCTIFGSTHWRIFRQLTSLNSSHLGAHLKQKLFLFFAAISQKLPGFDVRFVVGTSQNYHFLTSSRLLIIIVWFRYQNIDQNSKEIEKLIKKYESEGNFHGLGLFEVERSTLTAIFSTILTYVIVIVQFTPMQTSLPTSNNNTVWDA